ncbi:hypothetical protein K438DRAFT_1756231 [Mycena galopus ATCC 62051]|nr:hypothetical protein K438DRAFT_1756231 [Mycena galopus ATCC 62051]
MSRRDSPPAQLACTVYLCIGGDARPELASWAHVAPDGCEIGLAFRPILLHSTASMRSIIGPALLSAQAGVQARYNYGTFTAYVSGEAINGCSFVIDGNCNRLLRLPVDGCNTGGVNGKQGGYEIDLCGQWRTDPGCCGSDV